MADKIMVELKAVSLLNEAHLAQAINYLEAYNMSVGLLINLGSKRMEHKRFIIPSIRITSNTTARLRFKG